MYAGYVSYYLFFVFTIFIVFFRDYKQVERVTFMVITGFFLCYVIYIFLPVTGPQYYFLAIGEENVRAGTFPDVGRFFSETQECLPAPGWKKGFFYGLNQLAHQAGERPTAAFPSSHVAIATLVMLIVIKMRMWIWLMILAIPFLLLCLSTVYIQAHYAIDAIAGMMYGTVLFIVLGGLKLKRCGG
jgi:membrane-associated phospholipid phosphatase